MRYKNKIRIRFILFSILLTTMLLPNFSGIKQVDAASTHLKIKDGVTSIGIRKYANKKDITKVTIPKSVKKISQRAFFNCANLKEVVLLSKDVEIEANAFIGTKWYEEQGEFVVLNNQLLAYKGDKANVQIPKNITRIADSAFIDNANIKKVVIPDGVTRIAGRAFYNCENLEEVALPKSLTHIGPHAFAAKLHDSEQSEPTGNSSLRKVTIPKNVKQIGQGAFYGTPFLKGLGEFAIVGDGYLLKYQGSKENVTIPKTVKYIGDYSFSFRIAEETNDVNVHHIKSVKIPSSVVKIGEYAFWLQQKLEHVNIGNGVTEIANNAFDYCHGLKTVRFGNKVKTIGASAFAETYSLTSVGLPDSLRSIGNGAFYSNLLNAGVKTAKIPSGVTKIGTNAFSKNKSLTIYGAKGTATEKYAKKNQVKFKTLLSTPKANALRAGAKKVTGTATRNATVYVKTSNKTYSAKVNRSGKFSVKTAALKKGMELQVWTKDSKGNKSRVLYGVVK